MLLIEQIVHFQEDIGTGGQCVAADEIDQDQGLGLVQFRRGVVASRADAHLIDVGGHKVVVPATRVLHACAEAHLVFRYVLELLTFSQARGGIVLADLRLGKGVGKADRKVEIARPGAGLELEFRTGNFSLAGYKAARGGAIAARRAHGAVFGLVGKVAVEADHFREERIAKVADASFPVLAGFRFFVCPGTTPERGETSVHAAQNLPALGQVVGKGSAGQEFSAVIGAGAVDGCAAGIRVLGATGLHILVAQGQINAELVRRLPFVECPEAQGFAGLEAVVAARWGHAVLEHQGAIDLVVHIHRLEAIHFIFVGAGAEVEFVVANGYIEVCLHALGDVLPGVVLVIQAAGVNGTVENTLGIGVSGVCRVDDVSAATELVPVALKIVAVESRGAADIVAPLKLMSQADTGVGVIHLVGTGQPVAPVGILAEVRIGQAEVTGVGGFFGVLQLGGHALAISLPA